MNQDPKKQPPPPPPKEPANDVFPAGEGVSDPPEKSDQAEHQDKKNPNDP
ncbi:MAG: hypothetical protein V4733_00365 [Verrucomicrobiota bacterium]